MTLKPTRVNIQIREYLGNSKYGPSRSLTVYNRERDDVVDMVLSLFQAKEEKQSD